MTSSSNSNPIFDKDAPKTPRFNVISRITGQGLVKAVLASCFSTAPLIVPIFGGTLPRDMLEFPMPIHKETMIARRGGTYKDRKGKAIMDNQTVDSYRRQLISEVIVDDFSDSETEDNIEAEIELNRRKIEKLFPEASKKSREMSRSNIEIQTQTVLQKMMQLYPSEEIALQMSQNEELQAAMSCNDLIAWLIAFEKFCLSNEGNKASNIAAAEDILKKCKMKGLETMDYIKRFKQAAADARTTGSIMDEESVVVLFFNNLNHSEDAFFRYHYKILNPDDSIYKLRGKPLQVSLDHATAFHNVTILTMQATARASEDKGKNNNNNTVKSVDELERLLKQSVGGGSGGSKHNNVTVSHKVLATYMKRKSADLEESDKPTFEKKTKAKVGEAKSEDAAAKAEEKKKLNKTKDCHRFKTESGCKFGDKCFFKHG